ncbi:hypothetical protein ES707_08443 [subsurface metagenome]
MASMREISEAESDLADAEQKFGELYERIPESDRSALSITLFNIRQTIQKIKDDADPDNGEPDEEASESEVQELIDELNLVVEMLTVLAEKGVEIEPATIATVSGLIEEIGQQLRLPSEPTVPGAGEPKEPEPDEDDERERASRAESSVAKSSLYTVEDLMAERPGVVPSGLLLEDAMFMVESINMAREAGD